MHPKMRSNLASRRQASPSTSCKFGERCMGVPVHRDDAVQCPHAAYRARLVTCPVFVGFFGCLLCTSLYSWRSALSTQQVHCWVTGIVGSLLTDSVRRVCEKCTSFPRDVSARGDSGAWHEWSPLRSAGVEKNTYAKAMPARLASIPCKQPN
jgi:hypothetical protein